MTTAAVTGVVEIAARFERAAVEVGPQAFAVTRKFGLLAQTKVRANMSGRTGDVYDPPGGDEAGVPGEIGPRAITGDLRRSVTLELSAAAGGLGGTVSALVYSNEPQVLRLELGFVGVDALGRQYDQPPYPAWRPAFDDLQGRYAAEITALAALDA